MALLATCFPRVSYILAGNLAETEMMALLATCFPRVSHILAANQGPETEMRAFQMPFDRKKNRGRLITSLSHHLNRKPEMVALLA